MSLSTISHDNFEDCPRGLKTRCTSKKGLLGSNAVLVLGTVVAYHAIRSFIKPMLHPRDLVGIRTEPATITRRSGLEKRAPGDEIWNQVRGAPG